MRSLVLVVCIMLAGCADSDAPLLDAAERDSDGDGFSDEVEEALGSDPANATSVPDTRVEQDITFGGTVSVTSAGLITGLCEAAPVSVDSLVWSIEEPEGNVSDISVDGLTFTATGSATQLDIDIYVYGPGGGLLESGTSNQPVETVSLPDGQPAGDYEIAIHGCLGTGEVDIEASGILSYTKSPESVQVVSAEPA